VLVVTYEHADEIGACLDGVAAQDEPLEVVIADNASSDGTVAALEAHALDVQIVARERNEGFSAGVIDAFAASSGPLVLLLNPDCVMDRGCIAALRKHLDAHPDVGGVAASLRGPDGELQRFARRECGVAGVLWTMTETGRRLDQRFKSHHHIDSRRYEREWAAGLTAPLEVDMPAAACVLLRRELLEPRPLDPELPLFFSDAELFRRSREAGWRFEVLPEATAFHGYGTSHRRLDLSRRRAEWIASLWRYTRVWRPWQRAALAVGLALDAGVAALLRALGRSRPDTHAFVRGTLGGLGLPGGAKPWLSAPAWREWGR
jgi:GT2 family glycosyltransferase